MKVLITGVCGFLGQLLMAELEQHGHELRLLDRVSPADADIFVPGSSERRKAPFKTEWPFILGEITDPGAMRRAIEGAEAIIHLAGAVTGAPEVGIETFRTNAVGTFIGLNLARQLGVKRFFVASSINVFGTFYWRLSGKPVNFAYLPLDEATKPVPEDPYSLSKLVNEESCAAFHRAYDLTTAAFRFAVVWPDERYQKAMQEGLPPTTEWSDALYQWVHAQDVVRGLRLALEDPRLPGIGVYTLGGADTRCPEPTLEILERFKPDLLPRLTEPLTGRAPLLSIKRAKEAFGYAPRYTFNR
jgi:nucleoside-diphosphate-sugar epimerase